MRPPARTPFTAPDRRYGSPASLYASASSQASVPGVCGNSHGSVDRTGGRASWNAEPYYDEAFNAAFEEWEETPEASAARHVILVTEYPPATTTRLEAIRSRSTPYLYNVRAVRKETNIFYRVQCDEGYALRNRKSFVSIEALCPTSSTKYLYATREGGMVMHRSLDGCALYAEDLAEYHEMHDGLPDTTVASGVVDNGLYVMDDIVAGDYVIEYTGKRISSKDSVVIHEALDLLHQDPDTLVKVPSEGSVIDPRGCCNAAMYVNHHCNPNSRLLEVEFGSRVVVMIEALRDMKAGY